MVAHARVQEPALEARAVRAQRVALQPALGARDDGLRQVVVRHGRVEAREPRLGVSTRERVVLLVVVKLLSLLLLVF